MNSIQAYNQKIGSMLLNNQYDEIHKEKVLCGGGAYRPSSKPLPITNAYSPSYETPTSNLSASASGGKIRVPKVLKNIGQEVGKIATPALKKGATKLANALVDKGVNYLINGPTPTMASGMPKKRGRPRKHQPEEHHSEEGGKFHFIKTMKQIAKNPIVQKIGNKALDTAVNVGTNALIMGAMGAGVKEKRNPSKRNLMIKQLMAQHGCTMCEASKHIKASGMQF